MGKKLKLRPNIALYLAFLLFILALLSTHFTGGLYGRYSTNATGNSAARVAKFQVDVLGSGNLAADCAENDDLVYTLYVTNLSEVTVEYTVSVTFDKAPESLGVAVTLDGNPGSASGGGKTLTFSIENDLAPLSDEVQHKLQFAITDWTKLTQNATGSAEISLPLNFGVTVHSQQVD